MKKVILVGITTGMISGMIILADDIGTYPQQANSKV